MHFSFIVLQKKIQEYFSHSNFPVNQNKQYPGTKIRKNLHKPLIL
jgi:hypothetical protein